MKEESSKQFSFLYVEDNDSNRTVMRLLMEYAMSVQSLAIFEDSSNFMERVKALPQPPDVILLDIHVRPLDGFEMLDLLRADTVYHQSKIIAVTASVTSEEIEEMSFAGFDGGIGKPLRVETFPGLLTRILNGETVWHVI
jgi:two-component system, cell cycle response regulator DivK